MPTRAPWMDEPTAFELELGHRDPDRPFLKPTVFPRVDWYGATFGWPPWSEYDVEEQLNWACREASKMWASIVDGRASWDDLGTDGFTLAVVDRVLELNDWRRVSIDDDFQTVDDWRGTINMYIDEMYKQGVEAYDRELKKQSTHERPFEPLTKSDFKKFAQTVLDHTHMIYTDSWQDLSFEECDDFDYKVLEKFAQKEGDVKTYSFGFQMFTPDEACAVINSVAERHPEVTDCVGEPEVQVATGSGQSKGVSGPDVAPPLSTVVLPPSPKKTPPGPRTSGPTSSKAKQRTAPTTPAPPPAAYQTPTPATTSKRRASGDLPSPPRAPDLRSAAGGSGTSSPFISSRVNTPLPSSRAPAPILSNIPTGVDATAMQGEEERERRERTTKPKRNP